jgi:hypothetical protein
VLPLIELWEERLAWRRLSLDRHGCHTVTVKVEALIFELLFLLDVSFTIGLLFVRFVASFVALVLLIWLILLLVITIIPTLKATISNKVIMLTTIVAYSLGCGFGILVSFCELHLFNVFFELLHEESYIFIITIRDIFFFLFT